MPPKQQTDDLKSIVNSSLRQLWVDPDFIRTIVDKVTDGISKEVDKKLLLFENQLMDLGDRHKSKIINMETELKNLRKENEELKRTIEQLDQNTRKCNLRIFNYPDTTKESTISSLVSFLNSKMNIDLKESDVQECHRIGKPNDKNRRVIFLRLRELQTKHKIYQNKKLLKGTGLVVREDLSSTRRKLMEEAIKRTNIKSVWSQNGIIFVRKNKDFKPIFSVNDLDNLSL